MPTWKDRVKQAVTTGGSGRARHRLGFVGLQALGAGDDGKVFRYVIEDGSAWETGYGIYTNSGTSFARTTRDASSTGSALTVSTSAFLFVDLTAAGALSADNAARGNSPGGRLTLTTGVPITTADVTGATTIYYTPYLSDVITLWDGNVWAAVQFSETSLALGTITSGRPYDVFGYLSSGVLALEMLVWTGDSLRATAITVQDGRYCKSGDKTRLYLGTFRTTSTTTTEDSTTTRFVFNAYNRVPRHLWVTDNTSSWTYSSASWRQARGQTASRVQMVTGLPGLVINLIISQVTLNGSLASGQVAVGVDSTVLQATNSQGSQSVAGGTLYGMCSAVFNDYVSVGYHAFNWLERCSGTATVTFYGSAIDTGGGFGGAYTNGLAGQWLC
jgi:hypothetical protein